MRFAAVQIPAKIGARSLNGEKLDELHCVSHIFGQFAVLHAHSTPISSRRNLQGGLFIVTASLYAHIPSFQFSVLNFQFNTLVLVEDDLGETFCLANKEDIYRS